MGAADGLLTTDMASDEREPTGADPPASAEVDGARPATTDARPPVRTDGGSGESSEDESGSPGGDESGGETAVPEDVDRGLVRAVAADLKRPDVRFLSAIRDINAMPENYPEDQVEAGEVPASKPAIRDAAGLTNEQVNYRLRPGERGLEQMGPNGLLDQKAPPYRSGGAYGPRSAELTDFGKMVLAEAEDDEGMGDVSPVRTGPVSRDEFDELAERIDAWEDREMGAIDPDLADDIRSLFREMVKFYQAFEALGIDAQQVFAGDELTASDQEQIAEAMTTTLLERAAEREGVSLDAGAGERGAGAGAGSRAEASGGTGGPAGGAGGGSGNAEAAAPGSEQREPDGGTGDPMGGGGSEGESGSESGDGSAGLDEFGGGS